MSKINYEFVKRYFEKNNCVLLEDNYVSSIFKMRYICDCGNESLVCWSNFRRGNRCKKCGTQKTTENHRLKQEYVKKYFEDQGCVLLDEYKDSKSEVRYICSCGREGITMWSRFVNGSRCINCFAERQSKIRRHPDQEMVKMNKIIARRCNSMLRRIFKGFNNEKKAKSVDILGYSKKELREHLMSHPNWKQVKDGDWSIDHIFPVKAFMDFHITNMRIINCLDNLQPMLLMENMIKNDRYSKKEFIKWLKKKNIDFQTTSW